MWLEFFQSVVVIIALLYVPGVILLHTSGMPKPWALVSAPLVSCALFFIEGEIFSALNIPIPLAVMVLVPLLIAALVNGYVFILLTRTKKTLTTRSPTNPKQYALASNQLALYQHLSAKNSLSGCPFCMLQLVFLP